MWSREQAQGARQAADVPDRGPEAKLDPEEMKFKDLQGCHHPPNGTSTPQAVL